MSGDNDVSKAKRAKSPLLEGVYERSKANIQRLKERLPEDLVASLAREVIQRIASRDHSIKHVGQEPSPEELEELCRAFISDDDRAAARLIAGMRADGTHADAIYLKYLAAAARMLGDWWTADKVSFAEVTYASGRMFAIMRGMKHLFEPAAVIQDKRALFASVPGENHTLGVRMAADMFRKDGWEIDLEIGLDHDTLVSRIEACPNGIVGLSIGGAHSIDALSRLVIAVHICCPHAVLIVSGQNVEESEPLLSLMGLDGIVSSVDDAKELLSNILQDAQATDT